MARFHKKGSGSRWVRGFDWDYASFGGVITMSGGVTGDWLRCPSDTIDPLQDQLITAKTLTRLLLSPFFQIQGLTAPPLMPTVYLGIIAWDWNDPNAPPAANLPDASNGAYDWVARIPMTIGYTGGGGTGDAWYSTFQFGTEQGVLDFSSQRKLPPGRGLLWTIATQGGSAGSTLLYNFDARFGLKGDVTARGLGGGF